MIDKFLYNLGVRHLQKALKNPFAAIVLLFSFFEVILKLNKSKF